MEFEIYIMLLEARANSKISNYYNRQYSQIYQRGRHTNMQDGSKTNVT